MCFGVRIAAIRNLAIGLFAILAGAATAPEQPAAIPLAAQPAIAPDVAAFPRVAPPLDAQAHRIDDALDAADARVRSVAGQCRADGADAQADPKDVGWQRGVAVAMNGPRFLALVANDTWFCGGAYPSAASFALAYDLNTGAPLNWERLLPKSLAQHATLDSAGDGTRLGVVASGMLKALYLKTTRPDSDCAQALHDEDLKFMLWPDAEHEGVALQPVGLPHVVAACGETAVIPVAVLGKLGVDAGLLDAIAAGHAAGLFGPKSVGQSAH